MQIKLMDTTLYFSIKRKETNKKYEKNLVCDTGVNSSENIINLYANLIQKNWKIHTIVYYNKP